MIKFFRHIRRQLLGEGKMGKYFKYAIGEILLVVIGILIALQINNANEKKIAREFERKMLVEIENALNNDIVFFKNHLIKRMERENNARLFFENYILTNKIDTDSIDYHYYRLNYGIQVTYNKGPYEALKSTGIDKVRNDSLRNSIINLYEFTLPRYKGLIDITLKNSSDNMQKLYLNLSNKTKTIVKNDTIFYRKGLSDKIDLINNPDFLNLLQWSRRSTDIIEMLNYILPFMEDLVANINLELHHD